MGVEMVERFITALDVAVSLFCSRLGTQALEAQRDGLEHLMRIVKKDMQDLEVRSSRRSNGPHGVSA